MSFDSPKDLIKWGRDGTNELDAACRQFFDDGALKGFTEIDPQTGEKLRKVRQVKPIPSKITRLANEAINNIRHSFDQALFSAASLIGKPMKQAYFPWASNPTDLDRLLASANRGIPAELHEVIRRLEPYERGGAYPGGDDTVRALAKIAGVRKHTIALRVGAQPSAVVIHELTADGPFSIPSFQWDKANNEMIVLRSAPDTDWQYTYHVELHVAINDPGILDDQPICILLSKFAEKAEEVCQNLEEIVNSGGK